MQMPNPGGDIRYPEAEAAKVGTGPEVMGVPVASKVYYASPPLVTQTPMEVHLPQRDWKYGTCHCCQDCSPCVEAWCCYYCQLSRQYNVVVQRGGPTIDGMICLAAYCGDYFCGGIVSPILHCSMRTKLRESLNIRGTVVDDFCCALCCGSCTLQQSLMEMTAVGMFPGACCYEAPPDCVAMQ
ncbi:Ama1 protein [Trypanosoma rangeli]|uniref:Ama1 protein n=1 Tax=Trypanosoma rangeli TaxID=5698 RepID=A0A422NIG0_TRYRA|nr:Ama1 protein [Trypanosoma rangeli]RNF05268.1 Ama1 protein [Trypanosoma rangeli]|eukprot:RNF05268.1 Ama1 protein [Trypanosoma rangeli]